MAEVVVVLRQAVFCNDDQFCESFVDFGLFVPVVHDFLVEVAKFRHKNNAFVLRGRCFLISQ